MKKKYTKKPAFYFEENSQDYKLPGFNFLYDAPEDACDLFTQLYDNVPILESAVNVYTNLINGDYEVKTKDPELANDVYNIFNTIKFDSMLDIAIANTLIYGYGGTEIVLSSGLTDIEKFVDIPHNELRIKRDTQGNIIQFIQLNTLYTRGSTGQANILNKQNILWLTRKATSDHPYGRSIFKSMPFLTKIMLEMQDSIGKIYKKYGSPRYHVKYVPAIQLDDKVLKTRLDLIKNSFNKIDVGKDFFSAGDVEVNVIGAGGKEIKFTIEMSEIMQGIFSGIGLPAGVLGYNYGSTETHLATQVQVLLGNLMRYQRYYAGAINMNIMPLIAKVYNLPEIPYFTFATPIIVDELGEMQVRSAEISNVKSLLEMGMIEPKDGQIILDLPVKDIEKPESEAEKIAKANGKKSEVDQSTKTKNGGKENA